MTARDEILIDLRERARYFAELTDVGVPRAALAAPGTMAQPSAVALGLARRAPPPRLPRRRDRPVPPC